MILRTKTEAGFTIVETMIVLAISGLMFALAINAMSGKQQETEFQTGIDTLKSELNSQLANVETGNYPSVKSGIQCTESAGAPSFSPPYTAGTCDIIGEAISFGDSGANTPSSFTVYPVFGDSYNSSGNTSTTIADANPTVDTADSQYTTTPLPFNLSLVPSFALHDSNSIDGADAGALGVISFDSFSGGTGYSSGYLNSGSQHVEIFAIPSTSYPVDPSTFSISGLTDAPPPTCAMGDVCIASASKVINPPAGITFCVESGTNSNDSALFTIGGPNNTSTVTYKIYSGTSC